MLDRAVAKLEARGYKVVVTPHALAQDPDRVYLAGSEADRLADLNALINNPDIDLIMPLRGGYGAAKLLDKLDYEALKKEPKPLVGYSDITALSLGIAAQTGIVTFSGIMATGGDNFSEDSLDLYSEASLWQSVTEGIFPRHLARPVGSEPWKIWRGAEPVQGPVFPVCLSLLSTLLGTPYVPDMTGGILVIEDVSEELYSVDRMLTQLRLAGILDRVSAVLIGSFNGVPEQEELLQEQVPRLVLEMTPNSVAVASGVAYGHIACRLTLPHGATATVNLQEGVFSYLAS
jgi:muramoyltetrapeptide carboxypeptidase